MTECNNIYQTLIWETYQDPFGTTETRLAVGAFK